MSQSRKHSLMESILNTASAFFISWLVLWQVVPLFWPVSVGPGQSMGITMLFTAISVVRNYFWRRHFNAIGAKSNA